MQLAKERGLLRKALHLYEGRSALRSRLCEAYGDALQDRGLHEDAGVAYIAAAQLTKALHAYRVAGRWRMVFALAGAKIGSNLNVQVCSNWVQSRGQPGNAHADRLPCDHAGKLQYSGADLTNLAHEVSAELISLSRLVDAAEVMLHHLHDTESGVTLLVDARAWQEALQAAYRSGSGFKYLWHAFGTAFAFTS